ncbi:MAG: hypothetical protein IPP71_10010 [Bacteroidetes bacterium]|nr:hypothetical protein [Bacteroidota bacterium]
MRAVLNQVFGNDCDFSEKVGVFHAGMDTEDRKETYDKFKRGDIVLLFSTKAFGMGMDIPNIHFVAHFSPPSTFEDFLQEVGRAGRNEEQRLKAGFNNSNNPIRTLCLTSGNDFARLKDQLHQSRISWNEIKDIKVVLENYVKKFKPLAQSIEIPVAVPLNVYSTEMGLIREDVDNKFRIALHWLEKLGRISLGYSTITHLEFDSTSLQLLGRNIHKCPDLNSENVCKAILDVVNIEDLSHSTFQISIAELRVQCKLSLEQMFSTLIIAHNAGILKLFQFVVIEFTKIRRSELEFCKQEDSEFYPAIKTIFTFSKKLFSRVNEIESKIFDQEELDCLLDESISETILFDELPWISKTNDSATISTKQKYIADIRNKRSKHAFTILRIIGKTSHDTIIEKVSDDTSQVKVRQVLFNGYHKEMNGFIN